MLVLLVLFAIIKCRLGPGGVAWRSAVVDAQLVATQRDHKRDYKSH